GSASMHPSDAAVYEKPSQAPSGISWRFFVAPPLDSSLPRRPIQSCFKNPRPAIHSVRRRGQPCTVGDHLASLLKLKAWPARAKMYISVETPFFFSAMRWLPIATAMPSFSPMAMNAGGVSFVNVGGGSPLAGPLVTPSGPE